MNQDRVSRREFVRTATAITAGAVVVPSMIVPAGAADVPPEVKATRSYQPSMEYRRLGKTGLWVSAVCLGGHWKRIDKVIKSKGEIDPVNMPTDQGDMGIFFKNRHDVVSRCIEVGINLIDFAGDSEPETYCKVLEGRRDAMYLAYSHPMSELRTPENRTAKKLLELFEAGLKRCKLEYADVWRLMALERGGLHTEAETEAMIEALQTAKQNRASADSPASRPTTVAGPKCSSRNIPTSSRCSARPTRPNRRF